MKKIAMMMMTAASVILTAAPLTAPAAAAEDLSAKITISVEMDKGYVLKPTEITVTDVTKDGKLDFDDALIIAHDLYYPGGAAAGMTQTTIWGREGAFGCYISDENGKDLTYGEASASYTGLKNGYSLQVSPQWLPFTGSAKVKVNADLLDGTVLENKEVEFTDLNKNGRPDIEDVMRAALNNPVWTVDDRYRYDFFDENGTYMLGDIWIADGYTVNVTTQYVTDTCIYVAAAKLGNPTEPGSKVKLIAMSHKAGKNNFDDAVVRNAEILLNDQPTGIFTDTDGAAEVTLPAGDNILITVKAADGTEVLPYHVARVNTAAAPLSAAAEVTTTATEITTTASIDTTTTSSATTTATQTGKAATTTKAGSLKTGDGLPVAVISAIGVLGMCVSFVSTGKHRKSKK